MRKSQQASQINSNRYSGIDNDEGEQITEVEKLLSQIFQDKAQYNRALKELSLLNELDPNEYHIAIQPSQVGLKIILTVSKDLINKKTEVDFAIILYKDFPYVPPKMLLKTPIGFPCLADGRDLLYDVLQKPYHVSITLDRIVKLIPNFIKQAFLKQDDVNFFVAAGRYEQGCKYDFEDLSSLDVMLKFSGYVHESLEDKDFQRTIYISALSILIFSSDGALQKEGTGILIGQVALSDVLDQRYGKQEKKHKKELILSLRDGVQLMFKFQDVEAVHNVIKKNAEALQQKLKIYQSKKQIKEEEVTMKFYEDMDFEQITENIQICEMQLETEPSAGLISTLQMLYSKAIEYLSAVGDTSFRIFIDKMQDLLSREDIQDILNADAIEKQQQSQVRGGAAEQRKNSGSASHQPQARGSQNSSNNSNQSVFDELSPVKEHAEDFGKQLQHHELSASQLSRQHSQELEKQKAHQANSYSQISAFSGSSAQATAQYDLNGNKKRFVLIQTELHGDSIETLYFDLEEKQLVCRKEYRKSCASLFAHEVEVYESLRSEQEEEQELNQEESIKSGPFSLISKVLEINRDQLSVKYLRSACSLQELALQSKITDQELVQCLSRVSSLLSRLESKYEVVVLHWNSARLSVTPSRKVLKECTLNLEGFGGWRKVSFKQQYFGNSKYHSQSFIQKVKGDVESLTTQVLVQESMYALARVLREILIAQKLYSSESEEVVVATFTQTEQLVNALEEGKFTTFAQIVQEIGGSASPLKGAVLQDINAVAQSLLEKKVRESVQEKALSELKPQTRLFDVWGVRPREAFFASLVGCGSGLFGAFSAAGQVLLKQAQQLYPIFWSRPVLQLEEVLQKGVEHWSVNSQKLGLIVQEFKKLLVIQSEVNEEKDNKAEVAVNDGVEQTQELFDDSLFSNLLPEEIDAAFLLGCFAVHFLRWIGRAIESRALAQRLCKACTNYYYENHVYADVLMNKAYIQAYYGESEQTLLLVTQVHSIRLQIFGETHPSTVAAMWQLANIYSRLLQEKKAMQWIERAISFFPALNEDERDSLGIENLFDVQAALNLQARNMCKKSIYYLYSFLRGVVFVTAQQARRHKFGENSLQFAHSLGVQARLLFVENRIDEAVGLYTQQLNLYKRVLMGSFNQHTLVAECYERLGECYLKKQAFEDAVKNHNSALEIRKKLYGEQHPVASESLVHLGRTYQAAEELQEALNCFQQALQIRRKSFGIIHTANIPCVDGLISVLSRLKQYDFLLEILSEYDELYERQPDIYAIFLNKKAKVLQTLHQNDQALEIQKKAAEHSKKLLLKTQKQQEQEFNEASAGDKDAQNALHSSNSSSVSVSPSQPQATDSVQMAQQLINLGIQLHAAQQYEEALEKKIQATEMVTRLFGSQNSKLVQLHLSVADTYIELQQLEEALKQEKIALQLCKQLGGGESELSKLVRSMGSLSVALLQKGQMEEALALQEKVQVAVKEVFGELSPYLELSSQIMESSINQLMQ